MGFGKARRVLGELDKFWEIWGDFGISLQVLGDPGRFLISLQVLGSRCAGFVRAGQVLRQPGRFFELPAGFGRARQVLGEPGRFSELPAGFGITARPRWHGRPRRWRAGGSQVDIFQLESLK